MVRPGLQLANAPFLRLLVPLCLGVSLQQNSMLLHPLRMLLLFFLILILLLLFRKVSFYRQPFWGLLLLVAILVFGMVRARQQKSNFPILQKQQYFVVLDDYPIEKAKSFQVVGQLINSRHKILAYLSKTSGIERAKPGDIFCFTGKPELIINEGNPFEFDYRGYLNNKGIGYRIFLKEDQFWFLNGHELLNISRRALIFRSRLIEILERSGISRENVHLIASISFGARDEVDRETIQSFTNTGVIHVLAVSGMNVGLIYVILNFLFRFLKTRRDGFFLHTLIVLFGIWGYALVTGMSASILRATMMFTFVVIGTTFQRNSNIFNSLAVSAFLLIAWDPAIIRDVGFQLSYAAVLSIVVVQPFIYKQLYFKSWMFSQIWLLLSVTFVAQIGTLPFTLHYFHQFPVYFWLANMVVIPLVSLILYLSFVVLFLSIFSGFLTSLCALALDWAVGLVLYTVKLVETFPHAVIKGLYPSLFQVLLVFLMGYLFYRYVKVRKSMFLAGVLLSAIVFTLSAVIGSYQQLTRAEIIFFNIPGTRALALTSGRKVTVLYDHCENASERLAYYLKPYLGERGIGKVETYRLSDSLRLAERETDITGNFIFFKGIRLFVQPIDERDQQKVDPSLCADLVWLGQKKAGQIDLSNFPGSKTILYRSSGGQGEDMTKNAATALLNMRKSVQLKIQSALPGSPNRIFCDYFNQTD